MPTIFSEQELKLILQKISVPAITKKYTAWRCLNHYCSRFIISGVKFYTDEPDWISMFHGFKHRELNEVDMNKIHWFLDLHDNRISENPTISEYIKNWISFIIQNHTRTETALVLKSIPGCGKSTFTQIISELFCGFSISNLSDINQLTGRFCNSLEGKLLIVLNEAKNISDRDQVANWDKMKTIITDPVIRIEEKFMPTRDIENIANLIFVSNNANPVKIENGDRRYVVTRCNGSVVGNREYWNTIRAEMNDPEFYSNLYTYFKHRDISTFDLSVIPNTETRNDMILDALSPIDTLILDHLDEFIRGIPCTEALQYKTPEFKSMKQYQIHGGSRVYVYILKEDCIQMFE
jgi:hypothetical protein